MNISEYDRELIDEMNRYYEARAPHADALMSFTTHDDMEDRLEPIVDLLAPIVAGENVLEVACGTGNWTHVISKRACSVMALDQSSTALKLAMRKLSGLHNITFAQSDAYSTARVVEPFSVAFAADFWSHIPYGAIPFFLDTLRQSLKTGARLVFLDMQTNDYFRQERNYVDPQNNRVSFRMTEDCGTYRVIKNFPSNGDLTRSLSPVADDIEYYEFTELERWMVVCRLR